ncbi:hypothetical protein SDC9_198305 [bioreactor metagenome]|uniref:Uncharacterized protein n=1 Tax=bioreactor metagenome TaxID=1076179 RepID=A0A645IU57_9ZZZZ
MAGFRRCRCGCMGYGPPCVGDDTDPSEAEIHNALCQIGSGHLGAGIPDDNAHRAVHLLQGALQDPEHAS